VGYGLRERGTPQIDGAACIGCGECVAVCPDRVLQLADGRPRPGAGEFMGCVACGHCVSVCPTGAISVCGRGMQSDDARELPPPDRRATADALEALLARRRSVRRFKPVEVPRETLDRLLEMTATAPMGIPPSGVGVVVFHGRQQVRAFAGDACTVFAKQARFFNPVVLTLMRPFLGKAGHEAMRDFVRPLLKLLGDKWAAGADHFTYGAPAALVFHHDALADPADCHIAAAYAMLAAESLGLGSCLLGTTVGLNYAKPLKAKYGIPAANKVGLGMALGYPAVEFRRGVRRRLADVRFM